ncbi:hypothetical protein LZZ90_05760 [Flavobacterium sp. SM15]|uniref:hypothetical protein n=1 Tax=Flavobacterium sp. SM15 TaxID=2908005 RepID=UPI001EDA4B51|nr:hypothetical protein [Flavobacterium sp. SM15]MCG2611007.1 hypothetical protein [Flavobacterium sp. SM15]
MKKNFLAILLLGTGFTINAQINTSTGGSASVLPNSPTTNTNVGIGTNAPSEKLEVNGRAKVSSLFVDGTPDGQTFSSTDERNEKSIVLNAGRLLNGNPKWRSLKFFDFPQSNYNPQSQVYFAIEDRNDFGRFRFVANTGGTTDMMIMNKSQEDLVRIFEDGNNKVTFTMPKTDSYLGIGTTSFVDGSDVYRLAVNGAVRAHRVKVYTTWADFVFEDNYKLPTLQEVEKHIKEKGHLKDIPSASEVEKNGIELGEMNKLLLQKVEELTLYIIELNKKIETLQGK